MPSTLTTKSITLTNNDISNIIDTTMIQMTMLIFLIESHIIHMIRIKIIMSIFSLISN